MNRLPASTHPNQVYETGNDSFAQLPDVSSLTRCPDCGSKSVALLDDCLLPVEVSVSEARFDPEFIRQISDTKLCSCSLCGLYFRWPMLQATDLEDFYRKIPSDYWHATGSLPTSWKIAREKLQKHLESVENPAVLDVGAFNGGFLRSLPESWVKHAIEPSAEAADQLSKNGIELVGHLAGDFQTNSANEIYDAIVLLDVFEHLQKPKSEIGGLAGCLKSGGVMLISTGNPAHWSWKLLGGDHWYLHTIQHCSFAERRYFKKLCDDIGLSIIEVVDHAHMPANRSTKLRHAFEVLFHWMRLKNRALRRIAYLFARLPRLGYLRHKTSAPFSHTLRDHSLWCLVKD